MYIRKSRQNVFIYACLVESSSDSRVSQLLFYAFNSSKTSLDILGLEEQ